MYPLGVSCASPYRIAAERPASLEPVAAGTSELPRARESEEEVESVACECDAPAERYYIPRHEMLVGMAFFGGALAVATAASLVIVFLLHLMQ